MLANRMRMAASGVSAGGDWWDISGRTCIGAWAGKGAASQAASYTDLSGTGNDLTETKSPDGWNSTDGWIFAGAGPYLETGILPTATSSMAIRFTNATTNSSMACGSYSAVGSTRFAIYVRHSSGHYWEMGGNVLVATQLVSGVGAISGNQGYLDGTADGGTTGAWSGVATQTIALGARNGTADAAHLYAQAFVVYSDTLTSQNHIDLAAAMAAL